jgi:Zn-finger nucleic acid-binding protein
MSDEQSDRDVAVPLHCPRCKAVMETVAFQDIVVDRCTSCRGLWFDALEQEHLAALKGSDKIDLGVSTHPKQIAPSPKLDCPICHTAMFEMVDHRHPNLKFESCGVCYGVFFNAGEFKEYKEHSVLQQFSDWLHR